MVDALSPGEDTTGPSPVPNKHFGWFASLLSLLFFTLFFLEVLRRQSKATSTGLVSWESAASSLHVSGYSVMVALPSRGC